MKVCLAQTSDLQGIIDLQKQNLPSALTPERQKEQGFVTVAHTQDLLERMNKVTQSVVVRDDNDTVVAYCLAMVHSFGMQIPELVPLFEMIDDIIYCGIRLGTIDCIYCGQICVGEGYRGQGLFDEMYQFFRTTYERDYPFMITEVASRNTRSLRAHERVGFQKIHEYTAPDGEVWSVVLWNWSFHF
jgi:GNAT superfamily N-acetyltransferase